LRGIDHAFGYSKIVIQVQVIDSWNQKLEEIKKYNPWLRHQSFYERKITLVIAVKE
jgi:hypothetical protein